MIEKYLTRNIKKEKTVLKPTQVIYLRYKSILDNNTKGIRQINSVTSGRKNVF